MILTKKAKMLNHFTFLQIYVKYSKKFLKNVEMKTLQIENLLEMIGLLVLKLRFMRAMLQLCDQFDLL